MDAKEIYYESLLTKMLFQKSSIKKIPLSGTFELSPVCNFDCRMCYVRKSPEEVKCHNRKMLNLEQWKKIYFFIAWKYMEFSGVKGNSV